MTETGIVKYVPSTAKKSWPKSARHILKEEYGKAFADPDDFCKVFPEKEIEKCKEDINGQVKKYSNELMEKYPDKDPWEVDTRLFPPRGIRHEERWPGTWIGKFLRNVLGLDNNIKIKVPKPVYKVPEPDWEMPDALDLSLPSEKPDIEKPGPDTKPDTKPIEKPIKKPVKATEGTKKKIELAVKRANTLIDNLKKLRRKDLADNLQKTANKAKKAKFEKEARRALKNLNTLSKKAREKIQEIMEGYEK